MRAVVLTGLVVIATAFFGLLNGIIPEVVARPVLMVSIALTMAAAYYGPNWSTR